MNLEEAIKTALAYEKRVHTSYDKASRSAKDPVGQRVFEVLAKEEQGHIDYLNACLDRWQKTGKLLSTKLKTVVPSREKIQTGLDELRRTVGRKRKVSPSEVELLQKAIKAEKSTSAFYKKMVAELDAEGQKLFARFVEIEDGHLAIVSAQFDAVSGLGYWFDVPEWQFQDG